MNDLGAISTRVLALAADEAKKANEKAEVSVDVQQVASSNVRFARNEATTAGHSDEVAVSMTVALGKRHATTAVNQIADASLRTLVERAFAMARLSPADPESMPVLGPQTYVAAPSSYDEGLAAMSADARGKVAVRAIAQAERAGVTVAGFFERDAADLVYANSAGLVAKHRSTTASYTMTARTSDGTGSGWAGAVTHRDLDDEGVTRAAIDKALKSASPRSLAPGKYTVILESAAVAEMLSFFFGSMDQRSADEGRSFFAKKIGQKLFADDVSLTSDPFDPETPGSPFDGEGLPLRAQTWIDHGKLTALQLSRYWASQKGGTPTGGHSVLRLGGGKAASVDELVKGTKRGLLVTRFWYTRMLDPQKITLTGLTRDGVFLIENGAITSPVTNFRYNESPVTVLKNIEAMTKATPFVPSEIGGAYMPAVRTHDFTMASASAAV